MTKLLFTEMRNLGGAVTSPLVHLCALIFHGTSMFYKVNNWLCVCVIVMAIFRVFLSPVLTLEKCSTGFHDITA